MSHHEKCGSDEVFVGNTMGKTIKSHLKPLGDSVRLGDVAYTIDGKPMRDDLYFPVFVKKSAMGQYDKIMMDRFSAIR